MVILCFFEGNESFVDVVVFVIEVVMIVWLCDVVFCGVMFMILYLLSCMFLVLMCYG